MLNINRNIDTTPPHCPDIQVTNELVLDYKQFNLTQLT